MTSRERFEFVFSRRGYNVGMHEGGMRYEDEHTEFASRGWQACEAEQRATQSGQDKVIAKLKEQLRCCRENVRRLKEREAEHMARWEPLLDAAQAVIDRWDSPNWKDMPATASYINVLRRELEIIKQEGIIEPPDFNRNQGNDDN